MRTKLIFVGLVILSTSACSAILGIDSLPAGDGTQAGDAAPSDGSPSDAQVDGGPHSDGGADSDSGPRPALGVQIDRAGRPLLLRAFYKDFGDAGGPSALGAALDGYNQDTGAATWAATYSAPIAASLALWDGLDGNCGNSPLTTGTSSGAYNQLAGVLADDRLWLDTSGLTSLSYFAVEANALAIEVNTDSGGRRPNDDVVDTTYSLIIGTALFHDGVGSAPSKQAGVTFPYLAVPQ